MSGKRSKRDFYERIELHRRLDSVNSHHFLCFFHIFIKECNHLLNETGSSSKIFSVADLVKIRYDGMGQSTSILNGLQ